MLRRSGTRAAAFAIAAAAGAWASLASSSAWGREVAAVTGGDPVPCARVEAFGGQAQVLNESRTDVTEVSSDATVPCGSWVSVAGGGWVRLVHRGGFVLGLGPGVFAQVREARLATEPQLVLFKGAVHATAGGGTGELRVMTANARARVSRGRAIVLYNSDEEQSQVVTLAGSARLENRFQPSRQVVVKAGEGSSLGMRTLRTVPTAPAAASLAAVRSSLGELRISGRELRMALANTQARKERVFAALLDENRAAADAEEEARATGVKVAPEGEPAPPQADRRPAGLRNEEPLKAAVSPMAAARTLDVEGEGAGVKRSWVRKLVGGDEDGERILFPDKFYGRPQTVKVRVQEGPEAGAGRPRADEELERRRLLEELSQIRPD